MPDVEGIVRHIRHAEAWLRWARSDCRRGNVRSAVLRLLLAEAEIRHAQEVEPSVVMRPAGGTRVSRAPLAMLGAATALVIAAAGLTVSSTQFGHSAGGPAAHGTQGPQGVVQLESGRLLTLVPSPQDGGATGVPGERGGRGLRGIGDDPATRFRGDAPVLLERPGGVTMPVDSEHRWSSF